MAPLLWDVVQYVSSSTFVNGLTLIGGAISLVTSFVAVLVVIRVVRSLPPNSGFSVHLGLGGLRMRFVRGEIEPVVPREFAMAADDGTGGGGDAAGPQTFAAFVERLARTLLRDARAITVKQGLPAHEAEDLLQDGLAVLADRWETARVARSGPRAYLYGVMRNLARGRRRGRTANERFHREVQRLPDDAAGPPVDGRTPEDEAVFRCDVERLDQALTRLTPDRREVVVLVHLRELEVAEAAVLLGKRESAVRTLLSKALKDLRTYLDEDEGGLP